MKRALLIIGLTLVGLTSCGESKCDSMKKELNSISENMQSNASKMEGTSKSLLKITPAIKDSDIAKDLRKRFEGYEAKSNELETEFNSLLAELKECDC